VGKREEKIMKYAHPSPLSVKNYPKDTNNCNTPPLALTHSVGYRSPLGLTPTGQ